MIVFLVFKCYHQHTGFQAKYERLLAMIKILIVLLLLIYFYSILHGFFSVLKITSCIEKLEIFLQSTSPSYDGTLVGNTYREPLNNVLAKYPDICEFTSYNSQTLGYEKSDYENYISAVAIYHELFMERNFLRKYFVKSLNPFSALKKLISFPSSLIYHMGFRMKPSFSKIFNVLAWIVAYLLTMYEEEIKACINSLLKLL